MTFENFQSSGPLEMTREQAREIFEKSIVPAIGAKGPPPKSPTLIVVAGQPGSGKSTTIRQAEMGLLGATQKIISDDFVAWVPGYLGFAKSNPVAATHWARKAGSNYFAQEMATRAGNKRANIIMEFPVPTSFAQHADWYKKLNYRTELHVVATPHFQSWTGVLDRAEKPLQAGHIGTNVLCPRDAHDQTYAGWARVVFDAERYKQVDRIVITRRDGIIMYDNNLVQQSGGTKSWNKKPQGLECLFLERHGAVSEDDANTVNEAWKRIVESKYMKKYPYLATIPLKAYQEEISGFLDSNGSRVNIFTKDLSHFDRNAIEQCRKRIISDISITQDSRKQFGRSVEFDRRVDFYAQAITSRPVRLTPESESTPHGQADHHDAVAVPGMGIKRKAGELDTPTASSEPSGRVVLERESKRVELQQLDLRSRSYFNR